MLYLHDVWVNWFEGEENGYNVCPFHEWRKEDGIELLDQVPLLYVHQALYHYVENDLQDLPKDLLDAVYKRAYLRKNQERISVEYAFVVTDGSSVLAVDTMGYNLPVRKSRLIPRQERLVYDMIDQQKPETYNFACNDDKEYHILSPHPVTMVGLTRKERQLKQLLMMALDQLQTTQNLSEVRYWLTEWDPGQYGVMNNLSFDQTWQLLYNGLSEGWSKNHEDLCRKLVKGQPFFEKLWELEQNQEVNKGV
ncbi:YjbA family protein [Pontibacillus sp. ALD_SL1]|uniref:YjbA family protein n=1 Tax=Pontibacillus sp. ALD_SL1 TaxID=2777185 RepID=UPI001A97A938|nr:YjbA family protein [Pontibacillus sp. ALD_SL1]QST00814.1 YjbA family protein [Pontibacillus sp. ALD_SL1]